MYETNHLEFTLKAPSLGLRLSDLVDLLDRLEPIARNELLTPLYLAYEVSFEEKGTRTEVYGQRYDDFKRIFSAANAMCKSEEYLVFGLVSFVLAEASRRSDVSRFERIIDGHRSLLTYWRSEAAKEEIPAGKTWQEIRQLMDKIESLHNELEESRRVYHLFCADVVKPLL